MMKFYATKHFSSTVLPGAKRIAVSGGPLKDVAAFLNPSGTKILIFANDSDQPVTAELETGDSAMKFDVPAKSMNTVTISTE